VFLLLLVLLLEQVLLHPHDQQLQVSEPLLLL